MDKQYQPQAVESEIYQLWEKGGYFTPKIEKGKKPYTILLPLPNANDPMHMGHALFTVQDILVRYHRMKGDPTLWLPGGDHAGIETQFVFEKQLSKQGKSRFDFDRETLYKMIAEYVEKNKNINRDQMKRLGFSLDWTRYHYSLEPKIVDTVLNTFFQLHKDGLVYRDERLVNYCTRCGTGFSDLEIIDQETTGSLYIINFPLLKDGFIQIATTRPETILGDVAVMVNPKDKRYKNLVGQTVVLPVSKRKVPVIADSYVDMKFGTGAVKVTPNHDFNDFEIAKKHKLYSPPIIGFNGKIQNTNTDYDGLKVLAAREKILNDLTAQNLLVETKKHNMVVKTCYKCGRTLEPLPLPQWYVKTKLLAKPAIQAVKQGKTKIEPLKRFEKLYFDWMENILDWNISRQIVWGPRLPVWYKVDGHEQQIWVSFLHQNEVKQGFIAQHLKNGYSFEQIISGLQRLLIPIHDNKDNQPEVFVGKKQPPQGRWIQETDTFDTWFLSSQWPLTTLGFPDSEDFKYFYPTSVLDTMWDILFFWVARMMMMGLYCTKEVPFRVIHLHCRVVDAKGQKMAKSRGNVMNPIDMVDKYGADALRFSLIFGAAPGTDIALHEDKVRSMRNFSNKVWNIARFIVTSFEDYGNNHSVPFYTSNLQGLTVEDKKIIKDLQLLIKKVTANLENYRFDFAAEAIYHFLWHRFADEYIEYSKVRISQKDVAVLSVLRHVFLNSLKLLHPFMPFITEAIWEKLPRAKIEPLIISPWPM